MKEFIDKLKASKLWTTAPLGIPLLFYIVAGVVVLFIVLGRKMKTRRRRLAILARARRIKKRKRKK